MPNMAHGSVVDYTLPDPKQAQAHIDALNDPEFHGGMTPRNPDGQDTQQQFGIYDENGVLQKRTLENGDSVGVYTEERTAFHQEIIDRLFEGVTPVDNPVCEFTGGGPSSGKSNINDRLAEKIGPNHVAIDADKLKQALPEVQVMGEIGDETWAGMSHEESSDLCKMALNEAAKRGVNTVYDGTGNSDFAKLSRKAKSFRDAGFEVNATYVTVPVEVAVDTAYSRGKKPAWPGAKAGRVVPPSVIRETHRNVSAIFPDVLSSGIFDSVTVESNFSTDGKRTARYDSPVLLASSKNGKATVHDEAGYAEFLAKNVANDTISVTSRSGAKSKIVFSKMSARIMRKARKNGN
jgi:hypothetical protein